MQKENTVNSVDMYNFSTWMVLNSLKTLLAEIQGPT